MAPCSYNLVDNMEEARVTRILITSYFSTFSIKQSILDILDMSKTNSFDHIPFYN